MSSNSTANPLLNFSGFPSFSLVRPEHIKPAVEKCIAECKETVIKVTQKYGDNPTWDNLMAPIEEADDHLSRAWSVSSHLNSVVNTPELRQAHDECLPMIAEFSSWVGQYRPLFEAMVKLEKSDDFARLTKAQRKAVENSLRDFRLSGVDLSPKDQEEYARISSRLSQLQ